MEAPKKFGFERSGAVGYFGVFFCINAFAATAPEDDELAPSFWLAGDSRPMLDYSFCFGFALLLLWFVCKKKKVDDQLHTNVPGIFAIGDVVRGPMLVQPEKEKRWLFRP